MPYSLVRRKKTGLLAAAAAKDGIRAAVQRQRGVEGGTVDDEGALA
jgi:hypothetical protein